MEMKAALELVGSFTADQWGMVTAKQAKSLGVDAVTIHRLRAAGLLEQVRHGVHAVTTAALSYARVEQAAWLALDPGVPAWERQALDPSGGVLSHGSAARLHGLGELVDDRISFTVPHRRTSRDRDLRFRHGRLETEDVTLLDGLPVTTVQRTVCDLLAQHTDASHVAVIIRQAVESGKLRLDQVAEAIAPYARRYGAVTGDGAELLDRLLTQIGTSTGELAIRPFPSQNLDASLQHALTALTGTSSKDLRQGGRK